MRGLILRYALFALIASAANLGAQRLVLAEGTDWLTLTLALLVGSIVGLVVKYALDRRWIFFDDGRGARHHSRQFTLYTLTGGATTALFWGTETGFWLIWGTDLMRELGAALGLAAGYVIKYRLDRRFVFNRGLGAS